jgi:hypothetical protein
MQDLFHEMDFIFFPQLYPYQIPFTRLWEHVFGIHSSINSKINSKMNCGHSVPTSPIQPLLNVLTWLTIEKPKVSLDELETFMLGLICCRVLHLEDCLIYLQGTLIQVATHVEASSSSGLSFPLSDTSEPVSYWLSWMKNHGARTLLNTYTQDTLGEDLWDLCHVLEITSFYASRCAFECRCNEFIRLTCHYFGVQEKQLRNQSFWYGTLPNNLLGSLIDDA